MQGIQFLSGGWLIKVLNEIGFGYGRTFKNKDFESTFIFFEPASSFGYTRAQQDAMAIKR